MTLDDIKTEAAPGETIKADHIDGIIDSISSNVSYSNLVVSCTAVDVPVILNQRNYNMSGTMSVSSVSAGAYLIISSGNQFSVSSFFHVTSKAKSVIFTVGDLFGTSAVEIVIRDTNGYVTSLSANEGFVFKIEN